MLTDLCSACFSSSTLPSCARHAVYLFLRWVYARAGITSHAPYSSSDISHISTNQQPYQAVPSHTTHNPLFPKQGALAFVHSDSGDTANGSDHFLIESQLEMSDYAGSGAARGGGGGGSSVSSSSHGHSSSGGSSSQQQRDNHKATHRL